MKILLFLLIPALALAQQTISRGTMRTDPFIGEPRGIQMRHENGRTTDAKAIDIQTPSDLSLSGCTISATCDCTYAYDPISNYDMYEEFLGEQISATSNRLSQYGWKEDVSNASQQPASSGSTVDHPGILRLHTNAVSTANIIVRQEWGNGGANGWNPFFISGTYANNWFYETMVRWANAPSTNVRAMVGLYGNMPVYSSASTAYRNLTPTDFMGLRWNAGNWECYTCSSSVCSSVVMRTGSNDLNWHKVRFSETNASPVTFTCNFDGETYNIATTNIPNSMAFAPYTALWNGGLDANTNDFDVDYLWFSANLSR